MCNLKSLKINNLFLLVVGDLLKGIANFYLHDIFLVSSLNIAEKRIISH